MALRRALALDQKGILGKQRDNHIRVHVAINTSSPENAMSASVLVVITSTLATTPLKFTALSLLLS